MPSGGGLEILSVSTVWNSSLWILWSMRFLGPGATGGSMSPVGKVGSSDAIAQSKTDKPFMACDNNQNSV